ncbi:MAG: ATP-binding protein, partial [Nitriliruptorales bacterium]|nr:ATP-binding protein [Nitriliruptorales bacterium]
QVGASVAQQAALAIEHARLYAVEQENVRQLEALDQLKADYIAGISHDLKTPLTGLLGFTKTLNRLGPNLDAERLTRYLGLMERQALVITAMVEDLLLAARLEQGDVQPGQPSVVDLGGVLADALDLYPPEQRARLIVDVHGPVPVLADESQILRAVHNLIDNALKYSPDERKVDVAVFEERGQAVFEVRDRGPGVPAAERDRIFERFAPGSSGEERGSTGLGLYISRGIARGHGGDLTYLDLDGQGACFRLRLPVRHGEYGPPSE